MVAFRLKLHSSGNATSPNEIFGGHGPRKSFTCHTEHHVQCTILAAPLKHLQPHHLSKDNICSCFPSERYSFASVIGKLSSSLRGRSRSGNLLFFLESFIFSIPVRPHQYAALSADHELETLHLRWPASPIIGLDSLALNF